MIQKPKNILAEHVRLDEHFSRSTNIELDSRKLDSVPEYRFTPKSLRLLDDVLDDIQGTRKSRVWSIIGPYGSGKSTFLLLLMQLLSGTESAWVQRCLVQLRLASPEMERKVCSVVAKPRRKYIPVILQGSRAPLDYSMCRALLAAATDETSDTSWVSASFLSSVNTAMQILGTGVSDSRSTVELYKQAANLAEVAGYNGLLVIIDEFGKFLERARWQGDLPDLAAVQYLAELSASYEESRILFLVALHQGFQHYATSLSRQQWLEWVKIQGRFGQVDFNEEPENLYGLVAASIKHQDKPAELEDALEKWVARVWAQVRNLHPFRAEFLDSYWPDLLKRVYPLHPVTLYALPRLSANLGQNERTLFTFLASDDPLGLRSFLRKTPTRGDKLPSLTVDYLYDYFVNGSRTTWLPLDVQRRVNEIESALERLGDRPGDEARMLKIIGVLSLLRSSAVLPISERVLAACQDGSTRTRTADVLNRLVERKLLVYRKYSGTYKVWEGSDFDFDGAIEKARESIQSGFELSGVLNQLVSFRPITARRHSFKTGTNRLFRAVIASANDLEGASEDTLDLMLGQYKADGLIVYTAPSTIQEIRQLRHWVTTVSHSRILFVIPEEPIGLDHLAQDLAALRSIQRDCPELEDDNVAIKEVSARIESVEELLYDSLDRIINPSSTLTTWYWKGNQLAITNNTDLNVVLSDICDSVYSMAPNVNNELINRESISASVVVAVKKIINGLMNHATAYRLGMLGNGPEVSIYTKVLEEPGLHSRKADGTWELAYDEGQQRQHSVLSVLDTIEAFYKRTELAALSSDELYRHLTSPPYGMRKGLISLLIWISLVHKRKIMALYENGTYINDWSVELYDRFVRSPESFSVRRLLLSDASADLLQKLNSEIPDASPIQEVDGSLPLNEFLVNIFAWYSNLPDYTKQTARLSTPALEFRRLLLSVVDPVEFIYDRIPTLLELDEAPITIDTGIVEGQPEYFEKYASGFGNVIDEIDNSYKCLMDSLISLIANAFRCHPTIEGLKETVDTIDAAIIEHMLDTQARAFIMRARQLRGGNITWIESIVSVLAGQAPRFWSDQDLKDFISKMPLVALELERARRRHYAHSVADGNVGGQVRRIAVEERGKVVYEDYFLETELTTGIDALSNKLIDIINDQFADITSRSRQVLLARALELLAGDRRTDER